MISVYADRSIRSYDSGDKNYYDYNDICTVIIKTSVNGMPATAISVDNSAKLIIDGKKGSIEIYKGHNNSVNITLDPENMVTIWITRLYTVKKTITIGINIEKQVIDKDVYY